MLSPIRAWLLAVVSLALLTGCGGTDVTADPTAAPTVTGGSTVTPTPSVEPTPPAPPQPDAGQTAAAVEGTGTLTAPPEATATLAGPVDVETTTDLGFDLPADEPSFTFLSAAMPDGTLSLSCVTTGTMGTLSVQLDIDGTLALLQDNGTGAQVIDSDTLNERDRPGPGEEVVLSLACGTSEDGRSQALLSVDALGIQVVEVQGSVGPTPLRATVTSDPPTTVLAAFAIPAREVLSR